MKKPSLREVTRMVRETHEAWSHPEGGPEWAGLGWHEDKECWSVEPFAYLPDKCTIYGEHREPLGHNRKIDAVAIARRLIAGLP